MLGIGGLILMVGIEALVDLSWLLIFFEFVISFDRFLFALLPKLPS